MSIQDSGYFNSVNVTKAVPVYAQAGEFTPEGFLPAPRKFSPGESDLIFNMNYNDGTTFETVAICLQEITGKVTTAADVEREFDSRL